VEIIELPVEEWQAYRDLRLRALREDPQAFSTAYAKAAENTEAAWKARLEEARQGEKGWLLFARERDKLVGMIGAYVEDNATDTATIVSVYVPKEERGKGISVRLMEGILQRISGKPSLKRALLAVNKDQIAAVALYEKFGFRQTGSEPLRMGDGSLAEELTMERPLPYRGRLKH
jgi:ribosomal protein S18 acetylase RimI-like enzyme